MLLPSALIALVLGGAIGWFMAVRSFRGLTIPIAAPVAHGIANVTGVALLLVYVVEGKGGGNARVALGTLVVAALGGLYLLSFHVKSKPHPRSAIVAHAALAIVGVVTVLIAITHGARF